MKYIVLTNLKHNGCGYVLNDEIEIESKKDAARLLELKAVKPAPVKTDSRKGNLNEVPAEFKEYVQKTNNEQIAYILTLDSQEAIKALEPYSKAKAKQAITRRLAELSNSKKGED